jgi:hypothetical protein
MQAAYSGWRRLRDLLVRDGHYRRAVATRERFDRGSSSMQTAAICSGGFAVRRFSFDIVCFVSL